MIELISSGFFNDVSVTSNMQTLDSAAESESVDVSANSDPRAVHI